jgi:signal transduction histidine kinase
MVEQFTAVTISPMVTSSITVAELCRWVDPISPDLSIDSVHDLFNRDESVDALAVVDGRKPCGLIERRQFVGSMARRYWKDLFGRRHCRAFMDDRALVVEAGRTIQAVTFEVLLQPRNVQPATVIVTRAGDYLGMARLADLLYHFAEQQREALAALQAAQQQLIQAEKLSALGNLVAGLAHELNTPLGVSITAASILQSRLAADIGASMDVALRDGEMREALAIIAQNLARATALTERFRRLAAHPDEAAPFEAIAIDTLIADCVTSLKPRLREHKIAVSINCPPALIWTTAAVPFTQIVVNLLANAALHAYTDGGRVTIDVEVRDQLFLSICDFGKGIDPALHTRIFEPFFTTARGRGGTGLGLHVAYSLATRTLGGTLSVVSVGHSGTRFVLTLPPSAASLEVV